MENKYPITHYKFLLKIFGYRIFFVERYRFIVEHGVRPKDYKREVGSRTLRFEKC